MPKKAILIGGFFNKPAAINHSYCLVLPPLSDELTIDPSYNYLRNIYTVSLLEISRCLTANKQNKFFVQSRYIKKPEKVRVLNKGGDLMN